MILIQFNKDFNIQRADITLKTEVHRSSKAYVL